MMRSSTFVLLAAMAACGDDSPGSEDAAQPDVSDVVVDSDPVDVLDANARDANEPDVIGRHFGECDRFDDCGSCGLDLCACRSPDGMCGQRYCYAASPCPPNAGGEWCACDGNVYDSRCEAAVEGGGVRSSGPCP